MTTTTVVFDPFSDDYFNDPYGTYRRMRDEAPVYYSNQYDFYAPDPPRRRGGRVQGPPDVLICEGHHPRTGTKR